MDHVDRQWIELQIMELMNRMEAVENHMAEIDVRTDPVGAYADGVLVSNDSVGYVPIQKK